MRGHGEAAIASVGAPADYRDDIVGFGWKEYHRGSFDVSCRTQRKRGADCGRNERLLHDVLRFSISCVAAAGPVNRGCALGR